MDEYRGRYDPYGRRETYQDPPPPPPPPPEPEPEPVPPPGFALEDLTGRYLPILVIVAAILFLYFLIARRPGGIGGLLSGGVLGGILK